MEITATSCGKAAGCVATFHFIACDLKSPWGHTNPLVKFKHLSIILENCRCRKGFFQLIWLFILKLRYRILCAKNKKSLYTSYKLFLKQI